MLFISTKSASRPLRARIEFLEDKRRIILADHIEQVEDPEEGSGFVYDEVIFFIPDDRSDTLDEIEANFADWWEYGKEDIKEPTLEERVSDLEALCLALMEG